MTLESVYDDLPPWVYADALKSAKAEAMVHSLALTVFLIHYLSYPLVSAFRLVMVPFDRMRRFVYGNDGTIGFEMQSAAMCLLAGAYAQFGGMLRNRRMYEALTPGSAWLWAAVGISIGVWQLIAIGHSAENRAAAMVFSLAYWCALALVLLVNSGLGFPHVIIFPMAVAYLLCIVRLCRVANGNT